MATHLVLCHSIDIEKIDFDVINRILVYESLLFWPDQWLSITLGVFFFFLALLNVVFTAQIASEQIGFLCGELFRQAESCRVERFLAIKDRPGVRDNLELTYEDASQKGRVITIVLLLCLNMGLCMIKASTTSMLITVFGSFTSPLVIFALPGYLFYHYASRKQLETRHKHLSFTLMLVGVLMLIVMTTITFIIIRIDFRDTGNNKGGNTYSEL